MGFNQQILHKQPVSAVVSEPLVELGTRIFADGREYIYMYNGGGEAAKNRMVVATGTSGYTFVVTYATGAAVSPCAMGVVRNATIPTSSYGWVMTRGFTDVHNEGVASVTTGDALVLALNGAVRKADAASAVTQLFFAGIVGQAMQSTDTAGAIGAYVRLG